MTEQTYPQLPVYRSQERQILAKAFGERSDTVVAYQYVIVTREVIENAAVDVAKLTMEQVVGRVAAVLVEHKEWRGGRVDLAWVENAMGGDFAAVAALWSPEPTS